MPCLHASYDRRGVRAKNATHRLSCAVYACLICMAYMYALYVCLVCMPCMYVLYVCLVCMPYMYALYVCLTCMPYMYALYVRFLTGAVYVRKMQQVVCVEVGLEPARDLLRLGIHLRVR